MIDLNPSRVNYYTQLNNELDPKNACQCTAAVQCLDILGLISYIKGEYKQPEDNLRAYCSTKSMLDFCVLSHGSNWNKEADHPSEYADVLCKAINNMVGYKCAIFNGVLTQSRVKEFITKMQPVMVSMRYDKIPGHYVSVVGLDDTGKLTIDDPYKNDLDGTSDGYHCKYGIDDWTAHSKGYGIVFNRKEV